jgi:hypothetical protein
MVIESIINNSLIELTSLTNNIEVSLNYTNQLVSIELAKDVSKLTWDYFKENWSDVPFINTVLANGIVYQYNLRGTARYRYIPNVYNPQEDAFYSNFDGVNLTNLITTRG